MNNIDLTSAILIEKRIDFKHDSALHDIILKIIKTSYENPIQLLKRAYQNNNIIYIAKQCGDIVGFYMTGETLCDNGQKFIYIGLSGVKESAKNAGIGKKLYINHMEELSIRQHKEGKDIFCWATTASPSVLLAMTKIFEGVSPNQNGEYSQEARKNLITISKAKGITLNSSFPFLIKELASETRYSIEEKYRISKYAKKRGFTLFDKIGLDESKGDRLIFIAKVPRLN